MLSNKSFNHLLLQLESATDEEVIKNSGELLEWVQDCNWPVFTGVVNRLSSLGEELYPQISEILQGDDIIWKANIIGHLIPKFSPVAQANYTELLTGLLRNPSPSDFEEGVVDFIEMQLSRAAQNT